jgi:hypothetical protein
MAEKPSVAAGDWIRIGPKTHPGRNAVVSNVLEDSGLGDVEAVYLDTCDRPINEHVVWKDDHWAFKYSGPNGGYADKYSRLSYYVQKLRGGRYSRSSNF